MAQVNSLPPSLALGLILTRRLAHCRYGVLLAAGPKVDAVQGENAFNNWFARTITRLMKRENFVRNLDLLTGDTVAALDRIITRNGGAKTGVFDPFDDIYRIVYQLTMRTVGATEIAESPELLRKTLKMFEDMEGAASATRIAFPWLPTRAYFTQMMVGAQLYSTFNNIAKERKASGQRYEDAMQFLLDSDVDMIRVLSVSCAPTAPPGRPLVPRYLSRQTTSASLKPRNAAPPPSFLSLAAAWPVPAVRGRWNSC